MASRRDLAEDAVLRQTDRAAPSQRIAGVMCAMDAARSLFCVAFVLVPGLAAAEPPRVHFDLPLAIACPEVSSPEVAAAHPGQKLVEVRFEVSTLLLAGDERDLKRLMLKIESPQRTVTVVDYLPKTRHESRHAGPIGITKSDETNASLGINVAGKYELFTAAGANAGIGQKSTSCVKYDLLPPVETIAASGTLLRGAGAFFKLEATPQQRLEGAREYGLVLRVPHDWQADYLRVRCEAEGVARGFVDSLDQQVSAGRRDFVVALYAAGSETARETAERFAQRAAEPRTNAGGAAANSRPQPAKGQSAGKPSSAMVPWLKLPRPSVTALPPLAEKRW